ncbi:DinB family protein [Mucilaginibacter yixingensis]|uniref:DinB family protein n=1 Tax=Mucilaginibacter yixingensis TaxID=1295612 RepID=A0A2T5J879_9SPHI|nr:DinB family protein [Mucilaginibacter yixingensis]PTQ95642.1 DinB family protein [Mucilaginibacter yixingensis]
MNNAIDLIRQPRRFLLGMITELSLEQLNRIPAGFNNNIAWNLGHMVASQQNICYLRGGVDLKVDVAFWDLYKSGTRPEREFGADDMAIIQTLFTSTLDQLEADLTTELFDNYTPWTTRYGVAITNVHEAVQFLPFHDGLHLGVISSMKRLV